MNRPHETHTVTHTIKVTEMVCPECETIINVALSALPGVQKITSNWQKNTVTVTYDLTQVQFQDVEELLRDIGYGPNNGFIHRSKRNWIRFTEQNAVDNLHHVGHCCSKPPVNA